MEIYENRDNKEIWDDENGNELNITVKDLKSGDILHLAEMPFDRYEDGVGFIHHTGMMKWDGSQFVDLYEDDL